MTKVVLSFWEYQEIRSALGMSAGALGVVVDATEKQKPKDRIVSLNGVRDIRDQVDTAGALLSAALDRAYDEAEVVSEQEAPALDKSKWLSSKP